MALMLAGHATTFQNELRLFRVARVDERETRGRYTGLCENEMEVKK